MFNIVIYFFDRNCAPVWPVGLLLEIFNELSLLEYLTRIKILLHNERFLKYRLMVLLIVEGTGEFRVDLCMP